MKPFSLEEYLKNPSKKVVTREGRSVTIYCTNYIGGVKHIIAQVEGKNYSTSFYEDGRYANDRDDSHLDLFFAPEKHEGWFNIYLSEEIGFFVRQTHPYQSKDEAYEIAKANPKTFFATTKVEWEE